MNTAQADREKGGKGGWFQKGGFIYTLVSSPVENPPVYRTTTRITLRWSFTVATEGLSVRRIIK